MTRGVRVAWGPGGVCAGLAGLLAAGVFGSVLGFGSPAHAGAEEVAAESLRFDGPAGPESKCEDGIAERTVRAVQSRYDGIRDIRAVFEQTSESATFGGAPMMSPGPKTGRVVFAKPGKMRWTYSAPEPSVVVSDGKTLWIHDVEGNNVTRLEVTAGFLSGAAVQFLLGDGQILDSFEVSAAACDDLHVTLDLAPRDESTYERLGLTATRVRAEIVGTSVLDLFGNLTVIRFSEIETNRGPASDTFEFEVPDGVELIDYAGSQGL